MFERFTERARQVVVLAQEEARTLKHNYIGTEHILLGLLREEEGLAARVLESLDITVERGRGARSATTAAPCTSSSGCSARRKALPPGSSSPWTSRSSACAPRSCGSSA